MDYFIIIMIKLSKGFKKKDVEADKKIKDMKESWSQLEVAINSLVWEINQAKARTQEAVIVSHRCHQAPGDEPIGFHRNQATSASVCQILPPRSSEVLCLEY